MVVQGIVVNNGNQVVGADIKVLKIQYDGYGNSPTILENTTGMTFTIDPGSYTEIIPTDNTYFSTNTFWVDSHFIFDDSDPMVVPSVPTLTPHYVTTSGKLAVQRPGGLNILTVFIL